MNVLQTSDMKITATVQPVGKLNLKIRVSLKYPVMIVQKSFKIKMKLWITTETSDHQTVRNKSAVMSTRL